MADFETTDHNKCSPNYFLPPKLSSQAANAIVRLIVYEDYQECNYYRCDPVKIWEFEVHQPKKKKSKKKVNQNEMNNYGHPLPPWQELKKIRDWWCCQDSSSYLGVMPMSPLRYHIISALEKQSWTSQSPEEDTLFLLLRLCIDTQLQFSATNVVTIKAEWLPDLLKILNKLGPFPLQKLTISDDIFAGDTSLLSAIIKNSPNLQVLRIGQWELHNDILLNLGQNSKRLVELEINGMDPEVFMNDDVFFKCFFGGCTRDEVFVCYQNGITPSISFKELKYVDILFCRHTQRFLQMLSVFYPHVSMNAVNACPDDAVLANPFSAVGTQMPFLRVSVGTKGLLDGRLNQVIDRSSRLKTLMIHVDDQFEDADLRSRFDQRLETASVNLHELVSRAESLESFVLRPHEEVDVTRVVLSTFSARGRCIKSLSFIYDFSSVNTNTLFQLLNLCPVLERLVVDVSLKTEDVASVSFVTNLKENPCLETFVIQNNQSETEGNESCPEENLAFTKILTNVVHNSPNLINLSFRLDEAVVDSYLQLRSDSVERLHLQSDTFGCHFLSSILPHFRHVQVVSLEIPARELWVERLQSLSKSVVNITKKKPEFANVIPWHKKNLVVEEQIQIMVM